MDFFDSDSLNNYMKKYKRDVISKLESLQLNEKTISNQSDLICMVLDYSPRMKESQKLPKKFKMKYEGNRVPELVMKATKSLNLEKAPSEVNENESSSSNYIDNDDNNSYSENRSIKINSSCVTSTEIVREIIYQLIDNIEKYERESYRCTLTNLLSLGKIRVYILNTKNFIEIEFKNDMTFGLLKRIVFNKLENAVNLNIHHHTLDAYEFRFSSNKQPIMTSPPIEDNMLILDQGEDSVCFVEKQNYIASGADTFGEKPKKLYGTIISNTEESKINLKIHIKLDINNVSSTILQIETESTLKTALEKVSLKKRLNYKNIELYYFVEHSENNDNEDMDNAINMDMQLKYLTTFELDLYFKKFPDLPDYAFTYNQSYRLFLNEGNSGRKSRLTDESEEVLQEYVFNDVSAGVYQEFEVIKINKYNQKQERTLGIDMYNLYNDKPKGKNSKTIAGIFSSNTKNPLRKIKDVKDCAYLTNKSFYIDILIEGETKRVIYEVKSTNARNEIVAKLKYLIVSILYITIHYYRK